MTVTLAAPATLGALRVWNYNKSRIHSMRGARQVGCAAAAVLPEVASSCGHARRPIIGIGNPASCPSAALKAMKRVQARAGVPPLPPHPYFEQMEVLLDGRLIFAGEVRQAAGSASADALHQAELLLFTDSPAALAALEQRDDELLRELEAASPHAGGASSGWGSSGDQGRAPAATGVGSASPLAAGAAAAAEQLDLVTEPSSARLLHQEQQQPLAADEAPLLARGGRPRTAPLLPAALPAPAAQCQRAGDGPAGGSSGLLRCLELTLVLLESWGDSHFIGLSGLEVLGADGQPLPLRPGCLWASPPDLNAFPGHSGICDEVTAQQLTWPVLHHETNLLVTPCYLQATAARWTSCWTGPPTPPTTRTCGWRL